MSLVINIDTTAATALVNIAVNGVVAFEEVNDSQRDHAAFLHPAIQSLVKKAGATVKTIDAIAVSHGPGSYTGIRVGMAAAKGLCYAAGKPLIIVNELEILTHDAIHNSKVDTNLYCPMIDARRMEVFTAVYDRDMQQVIPPSAFILSSDSFDHLLADKKILFFGSGAGKWQQVCMHANAFYADIINRGLAFAALSYKSYQEAAFASLAYASPLYIKDFYSTTNV